MSKKTIILIISAILLVLISGIIGGTAMYYFLSKENSNFCQVSGTLENLRETKIKDEKTVKEQQEKAEMTYNEQFPDLLKGTISIISDEKTIIKTEDGKKYQIWPSRPMSFYRDSGIKNNGLVEIRGKILENNQISLGYVVPAK
ncbi:hypothetical protein KJ786_03670 [Patescibacteria group bacterium]|nr:hypothetical protein [Patescibacteria group bacterium]